MFNKQSSVAPACVVSARIAVSLISLCPLLRLRVPPASPFRHADYITQLQGGIRTPMVNASGNEVITLGFFRRSDAMRRIRDACLLWFEAAKALPRGQAPPRLMHWSEFKWVDRYIVHGHMMDTPKGERTSLMRKYMMLFHPDRFVSRFSCFFEDEGFNIIVARVQVGLL